MKELKIGVVGFSRNAFDKVAARNILQQEFANLRARHPQKVIEIVSGYTAMGIPLIAYELAVEFGFITTGFSAKQANRVRSGRFPVDKVMLHGERFGDESEQFVRYIDALIRVGGGKQSRHETALFKQLHAHRPLERLLKEFEVDWYGKT
ncbi:MAG: hypothetical protein AAFY71_06370 [Bacteroidota bacterium]